MCKLTSLEVLPCELLDRSRVCIISIPAKTGV